MRHSITSIIAACSMAALCLSIPEPCAWCSPLQESTNVYLVVQPNDEDIKDSSEPSREAASETPGKKTGQSTQDNESRETESKGLFAKTSDKPWLLLCGSGILASGSIFAASAYAKHEKSAGMRRRF